MGERESPAAVLAVDAGDATFARTDHVVRNTAILFILVPATFALVAAVQVLLLRVSRFELLLLGTMYGSTLVGVEVGFHRMVAHRGFAAVPLARLLLGIFGSMAAQGPIGWWVATHRRHHEHSDAPGDPHSPHLVADGSSSRWRGALHSHVAWMWSIEERPTELRHRRDVLRDRVLLFVNRSYFAWVVAGIGGPAALGWLWLGGLEGAARGALWGGFLRIFLVHNAMWCVASVCHLYGSRSYRTQAGDRSRNNAWIALFTFGESWHNNHHAFPSSARHGLEWWQIDVNYWVIRCLERLRLVNGVKVPTAAMKRARRLCEASS
jgi:stearoyl-CoA desaturase (Delta-9 desaturase)